nr:hypothetical protein [Pedobacter sp. ASV19]
MTRSILREFLSANGVKLPKVLLMSRTATLGGKTAQDLVFNLTPADFGSEEVFRNVMSHLGWFLPRHYSYVGMRENQFQDGFMAL